MKIDLNLGLTQAIITECRSRRLLRNHTAYVLATAYWESGRTMQPVREAYYLIGKLKTEAAVESWRKNHLRYWPWYGRGLVQLTWEYNYFRAETELAEPFTKNPDLALLPENAVPILVLGMIEGWFTGLRLSDYITLRKSDFKGARHIINGRDRDDEIADIAKNYDEALKVLKWG